MFITGEHLPRFRSLIWFNPDRPWWWRLAALAAIVPGCIAVEATGIPAPLAGIITGIGLFLADELLWPLYRRAP